MEFDFFMTSNLTLIIGSDFTSLNALVLSETSYFSTGIRTKSSATFILVLVFELNSLKVLV